MKEIKCNKCGETVSEETVVCLACGSSLAEQWIEKALTGDADAQNFVAWCYHDGKGVEQNDDNAAHYWELAVEQGHIAATNSLGACYSTGKGKPHDDDIAFDLFLKAAREGYATAQSNLGFCYRTGKGVLRMYEEAAKWYKLAAEQGDEPAIEALKKMKENGTLPAQGSDSDDISADKIYQGHGDHLDAIMDAEKLFTQYIQVIIEKAKLYKTAETNIMTEEKSVLSTIVSLVYGDDLRIMCLSEKNDKEESFKFITMYPYMEGNTCDVVIKRVLEWRNQIEATVEFYIGDRTYACFATDYFYNKDKYIPGKRVRISLSALGMKAEAGEKGFDFCGQQAVDFLAKSGREPDYDEQGNVAPLHFSLEYLVAYLPIDETSPESAEFQSPVGNIQRCTLLGVPFVKCDINITDPDDPCYIPLYFRKEFFPDIKRGDPVRGWLWLTGQINTETAFPPVRNEIDNGDEQESTISTWATKEDIANGWKDEHGVLYSKDGKRLLRYRDRDLKEYAVREGTKVICEMAFECCFGLTYVTLPEGLTSIGFKAFSNCKNLIGIKLPTSLKSIGGWAFQNCDSLESIAIPERVTTIEEKTFTRCRRLRKIILPGDLTSVGREAFDDCDSLMDIYINCSPDADKAMIRTKIEALIPMRHRHAIRIWDSRWERWNEI